LGHVIWVSAVLVLAIIVGAAIGETSISLRVVFQVLANKLWAAGYALDPIDEGIVWNYRLTRAIVGAACGSGLAICGVVLQSLLRNPLADPYLLGIS
ncbi:iron chelate uptake ABC transporter family permease subunit, partial [Pseudomonas viridiflava]|uniref:iron chelate uptake ABC transporter family permease subunit n=1 Tax=Pseudomonas viridiflava TaxID=33069 RepID=UPI003C7DBCA4